MGRFLALKTAAVAAAAGRAGTKEFSILNKPLSMVATISGLFLGLGVPAACSADPEQAYKTACALCHDAGIGGAPKIGDKEDWATRLKQGMEVLYKVAVEGKPGTAMIAKGGNGNLSDADARAAVDFIIGRSK